jgi:hypothetical protein
MCAKGQDPEIARKFPEVVEKNYRMVQASL